MGARDRIVPADCKVRVRLSGVPPVARGIAGIPGAWPLSHAASHSRSPFSRCRSHSPFPRRRRPRAPASASRTTRGCSRGPARWSSGSGRSTGSASTRSGSRSAGTRWRRRSPRRRSIRPIRPITGRRSTRCSTACAPTASPRWSRSGELPAGRTAATRRPGFPTPASATSPTRRRSAIRGCTSGRSGTSRTAGCSRCPSRLLSTSATHSTPRTRAFTARVRRTSSPAASPRRERRRAVSRRPRS